MGILLEKLKSSGVLVSDGAWGTLLQSKGLKPGECPEAWNIHHPDDVLDIAKGYIASGADMVETNSFGGNCFKLKHYGLDNQVGVINRLAAQLSRKATGKDKIVLGSIGPTGKILMMEDVTEDELYEAFKEQSKALAEGGADAIIVETMSDLDEARIAVKAARENTSCDVVCTMTFEKTVSGEYRTMMGVSPADMVHVIPPAGADIIGANCGNGIEGMTAIVKEIRTINKTIPVLIHANAGLPRYEDGNTVFPETPEQMAAMVPELIGAGADIIGGCCGTTPRHIQLLSETIRRLQ
jgi:5-methyltetrahydrofolate--homocysteine methyltransferase